jgi:1-acyl-sn-glycerol-3-phosphate acyltransferase
MTFRLNWATAATIAEALAICVVAIIGLNYSVYLDGYRKSHFDVNHYYDSTNTVFSLIASPVAIFLMQLWPHAYRGRALLVIASLLVLLSCLSFVPGQDRGGQSYPSLLSLGCGMALGISLRQLLSVKATLRLIIAIPIVFIYLVLSVYFHSLWWDHRTIENPPPLAAPSVLVFFLSLFICARPLYELTIECPTRLMYRMRAKGPGITSFPSHGPVLLIANHTSYVDPLFLAADVPRPLTPMMTSKFYDRWYIYPIVKYLLGVIRVPEVAVRREAPELGLAEEALDRGKCLVIFPEGYLQRKEGQPLRRFGRGVWEILKARPETPVVAAWIEGGWGSYFSYWNGPPTKGKRPDFRRPINIGYEEPFKVPKEVLEDHWQTRFYLMNKVGGARALLGLPRIPEMELPERDAKGDHRDSEGSEEGQK